MAPALYPASLRHLRNVEKLYYGEHNPLDVGILSKYNISQQEIIYPKDSGCGSILKATIGIAGHTIAVYSAHLDYKNYACYLPRGYNGSTWKKMTQPVHNADFHFSGQPDRLSRRSH